MSSATETIRETAPAKVNLLLHVGPTRRDGLHEICSLFASIDLADEVRVSPSGNGRDSVVCAGVEGPNLCAVALAAFREATAVTTPLSVEVEKRIPVAAGLGGGSADAAAVLRSANELAGRPLDADGLRGVSERVGADVPSQVEPRHALVQGAGERVEPISLPPMWLVLVPQEEGLATSDVYEEADRLGTTRPRLEPERVRLLAGSDLPTLAGSLENDLQPAALSLWPEIGETIGALKVAGALAALVTGSGPTVFGIFGTEGDARRAADEVPGAIVAAVHEVPAWRKTPTPRSPGHVQSAPEQPADNVIAIRHNPHPVVVLRTTRPRGT